MAKSIDDKNFSHPNDLSGLQDGKNNDKTIKSSRLKYQEHDSKNIYNQNDGSQIRYAKLLQDKSNLKMNDNIQLKSLLKKKRHSVDKNKISDDKYQAYMADEIINPSSSKGHHSKQDLNVASLVQKGK